MKGMAVGVLYNVIKWALIVLIALALLFYGGEIVGGSAGPDIMAALVRSVSGGFG